MIRFILGLCVLALLFITIKRAVILFKRAKFLLKNAQHATKQGSSLDERVITLHRCAYCGVYINDKNMVHANGDVYCSSAHRDKVVNG